MTHQQLVQLAENWLRRCYRCGIVLSEQSCASGETPDVIGWKDSCRSVLIECKISRSDFLADQKKTVRAKPNAAMGCERFYLVPQGLLSASDLPAGWGLLECCKRKVHLTIQPADRRARKERGFVAEMRLLLASLRRVEVRIEPQTITEFLKWKNRMAEYNGGQLPKGILSPEEEASRIF